MTDHPQVRSGSHVLDDPAWAALTGPQASLAEVVGQARRYPVDVCSFAALADPQDPRAWADLRELAGAAATANLMGQPASVPPGWEVVVAGEGLQMVATAGLQDAVDPEAVVLTSSDAAEVLDLVARTQPGPFERRTLELGTYLGLRRDGRLVAMAGERLRPPGWTEISAVCTDPAHRGQGLAGRLVRAVAAGIAARGDMPVLHLVSTNTGALRLYEQLGFAQRRRFRFLVVRSA